MQPEIVTALTEERLAELEELERAARSFCLRVFGRMVPEHPSAVLGRGSVLDQYAEALVLAGHALLIEARRHRVRASSSGRALPPAPPGAELWRLLAAEGWEGYAADGAGTQAPVAQSLTAAVANGSVLLDREPKKAS